MNKHIELYRPVGLTEYRLIEESGFSAFPPRLEWQPIFYPVLNEAYAAEIAERWNTKDSFSGYVGIVTAFSIPEAYFSRFEVQNVGAVGHDELWVPAEELATFNQNIAGNIRTAKVFYGPAYQGPKIELKHDLKNQ